jgi:hypothetical protein
MSCRDPRAGPGRSIAAIAYVPKPPHTAAGRQIVEMALAAMGNCVAMLIGEARPRSLRVTFQHRTADQSLWRAPLRLSDPIRRK